MGFLQCKDIKKIYCCTFETFKILFFIHAMLKKIVLVCLLSVCFSCTKKDNLDNNNPNLITPLVNLNLNLNLPEYTPLQFPGNHIIVTQQGIKGIVVYNINNTQFTAFEISDPNHIPNSCSKMTVEGIIATCPCEDDENTYDIVTGQHKTQPDTKYPMLRYRIELNGETLHVFN